MVRAIIVPGNGADGDIRRCNFYGWLADALHKSGRFTEVLLRNMPDPEGARRSIWVPFMLHELGADATTVVIGHSSGAVAALRLLEEHRLHGAVIVSPCHTHLGDMNELMSGYYPMPGSPFDGGEWQWEKIVENCNANLSILHADNDPFISLDEARHVAASLCYHDEHNLCEMRVVHGASHFFDPHEEILAAALKVAGRNGGGGDANGDDSGTVRHVMGGRAIRVLVLTAGLGAACCAGWEDQVRKALANGGGGAPSQGVPPPRVSILPVESTVAPDGVDSIASWGARLAQQLIDAPERHLDGRRPYILVGHDLGAWLAFEVVAELERRGREVAAPPSCSSSPRCVRRISLRRSTTWRACTARSCRSCHPRRSGAPTAPSTAGIPTSRTPTCVSASSRCCAPTSGCWRRTRRPAACGAPLPTALAARAPRQCRARSWPAGRRAIRDCGPMARTSVRGPSTPPPGASRKSSSPRTQGATTTTTGVLPQRTTAT